MDNFFIFDADGNVVGKPEGYKTFRAAQSVLNNRRNKVYRHIWELADVKREQQPTGLIEVSAIRRKGTAQC